MNVSFTCPGRLLEDSGIQGGRYYHCQIDTITMVVRGLCGGHCRLVMTNWGQVAMTSHLVTLNTLGVWD